METNIPQCVGFIMDGNRRWATDQGLPTLDGHLAGEKVFHESVMWLQQAGIPHGVYYAFSTENWKRTNDEVSYLMQLFESLLRKMLADISTSKVRVCIIGRREDFSPALQDLITELEAVSIQNYEITIWIALSYGGRAEILAACNEAIKNGNPITEDSLQTLLWTAGMPDPDIIIRTGGEYRLSNFLPWQSAYSELFFIDTFWPAFTNDEFTRILAQYGERQRRHGR